MDDGDFDDLCELAAHISGAPTAIITVNSAKKDKFAVLGRFGTVLEFGVEYSVPQLTQSLQAIVAIENLGVDERFKRHPFRTRLPFVDSAIFASLNPSDMSAKILLTIMNPSPDTFKLGTKYSTLGKLIRHAQRAYQQEMHVLKGIGEGRFRQEGFQEANGSTLEASSVFLLQTLVKRTVLRARGGTNYVAIRSWKKELKEFQIEAMHALKNNPNSFFVESVANEIHKAAIQILGENSIDNVLPVPCNSSRSGPCFSVLIGEAVARKLGVQCQENLIGSSNARGRSHPKKSAQMKPYELSQAPKGFTLIVDDVATTGKHLELAQAAVRKAGVSCFAIAWIGP